MRRSRSLVIVSLALTFGTAGAAAQPTIAPLSPAQRAALDAGQPVVITDDVAGVAWPRVTVLRFIPGPPDEAAAVFADYARHASYLPNVLRSEVTRVVDSTVPPDAEGARAARLHWQWPAGRRNPARRIPCQASALPHGRATATRGRRGKSTSWYRYCSSKKG